MELDDQVGSTLFIDWLVYGTPQKGGTFDGCTCIFTANDGKSGFPYYFICNSASAEEGAKCIKLILTTTQESYPNLRMDNGSHFLSLFQTLIKALYQELSLPEPTFGYSPRYAPWANHPVEAPHDEFNRLMRISLLPDGFEWIRRVDTVGFSLVEAGFNAINDGNEYEHERDPDDPQPDLHNWAPHVSANLRLLVNSALESLQGKTVHHSHKGRGPAVIRANHWTTCPLTSVADDVGLMAATRRGALADKLRSRINRNKESHDQKMGNPQEPLNVGDVVLKKRFKRRKLDTKMSPIYFVVTRCSTSSVILHRLDGKRLTNYYWTRMEHLLLVPLSYDQVRSYLTIHLPGNLLEDRMNEIIRLRRIGRGDPILETHARMDTNRPARFISWNVDGLRALLKGPKSQTLLHAVKDRPQFIFLQETKISLKTKDKIHTALQLLVPGYTWFHNISHIKTGYAGTTVGVLAEIQSQVTVSNIEIETGHPLSADFELTQRCPRDEGRVQCIEYQPPDSRKISFINLYNTNSTSELRRMEIRLAWDRKLRNYIDKEVDIPKVIIGDFNALASFTTKSIHSCHLRGHNDVPSLTQEESESFNTVLARDGRVIPYDTSCKAFARMSAGLRRTRYSFYPQPHHARFGKGFTLDYVILFDHPDSAFNIQAQLIGTGLRDHQIIQGNLWDRTDI